MLHTRQGLLSGPQPAAIRAVPHISRSRRHAAARAAPQQTHSVLTEDDSSGPQQAAERILELWSARDLEGLLPFMSELSVVKAVVRQHHAKLEGQKHMEKLQQQQQQQLGQQLPYDQQPAASSSSSYPYQSPYNPSMRRYSNSSGSGLATYDSTSGSGSSPYESMSPSPSFETQQQQQQHQPHWGTPPGAAHPPHTPPPPWPHCPVPGANSSSLSPDYIRDYESFNYAQRGYSNNAAPPPQPSYVTPFPGEEEPSSYSYNNNNNNARSMQANSNTPTPGSFLTPSQQQHAARAPDFLTVLDTLQAGDESQHLLDSYAMRHLVLSRPAVLEPLSGMRLGPGVFVLRVRSTSLWGEKCVLTFTLKRRSEQELKSTYSKHPKKEAWVLSKVVGEPLSFDPLEAISPEHPPEVIVAAQVAAFKECDFDVAYALTSPVGRAVAGTRDRFRAGLQGDYRYQPVLMHESATSIHRTHSNANTYLEVFDIRAHAGAPSSLFIWVATRQLEGLYKNCWMVEYVTGPIRDREVIKALQVGL